ncbi:MAG: PAS domain-containing protein [Anaerolineales bacterium]|nr:PAS domain-containing protein [Anaerolineales bacterium]
MPFELWGATGTYGLGMPGRPLGYALLLLYGILLGYLVYRHLNELRQLSRQQWLWAGGLWFGAFLFSQLFPISFNFDNQLAPLAVAQNPVTTLTLFTAVPFLLAGVIFGPGVALIAGLCSGFGQTLGQTHQLFDIFHFGFTAWLAATWLQQNYSGRIYDWLRLPIVSGAIATSLMTVLVGIATFAGTTASINNLAALDLALSTANANFLPLLSEGLFGGGIVMLILMGAPHLRPQLHLRPSPEKQSLSRYLLNTFARFAILLTVLLVTVVFTLATAVSTRLVINQMAHDANAVSAEIPDFQARLQNLLMQYSNDQDLLSPDTAVSDKSLRQLFRTSPLYRRILLVDANEQVRNYYPDDISDITLTDLEQAAIANALSTSAPDITAAQNRDDEHILSFVVPVLDEQGRPAAVLVGRVPELSFDTLIVGLQGTVGAGSGYIVDENSRIIAHPDPDRLLNYWYPPQDDAPLGSATAMNGVSYQGRQGDTNARELVYYVTGQNHPWTVVISVPYEVVLRLALNIGVPLTLVLLLVMGAFYFNLAVVGRNITKPLRNLVQASKTIAAGGSFDFERETAVDRDDEVGQLHNAFAQMQRSLKSRLDELSLLLSVSHDVSASIDINHSMPAILKGALRGTGASGARAIVFNPSGGSPLTFGEGPTADTMGVLDRAVATRLRTTKEIMLSTPNQIRAELDLTEDTTLPVPALIAIALHSRDRFQGVIWLGYRQNHRFDLSERNLLYTISSQASLLVENARLFATAEGGWRRLAAVLASTTDAVIVTDQTKRVLLINRAMERIFQLNAAEVVGRQVTDVMKVEPLVKALTNDDESSRNQEFSYRERTYYTNAAPIISNDGQALGRVAVLHDITHYKEVDELKSTFVSTVSHDLRSPLTFMRGYATMLPMVGEMNDKQRQYADKILSGIDQMAQLVDDLLDLGRIEAGVELTYNKIDIAPLLSDIAQEYWQHTHLNGIKLQVDVPADLPPIYGDQALIRQAITNYIGNGIKYAPNSGQMMLRAEKLNGEVIISVKDNGPGIPQEVQMRLFEKFFRAQQRGTEKIKGSGLGLAIVKSIAEKHGGRVWCQSEPGKGSTFYFSVPIANKQ